MVIGMKKTWIKTPILIILIITSIYQTTRLWFDDLSNRNFFYSFIDSENYVTPDLYKEKSYLITPEVMAIYNINSDKDFTVIKSTRREFRDIFQYSTSLLKEIISNGESVEQDDQENLEEQRNILMQFPFEITPDILVKDIKLNSNNNLKNITKFDEIVISPAMGTEKYLYVLFISKGNDVSTLKIAREDISELNTSIVDKTIELEDIELPRYTSTVDIKWFSDNLLLPISNNFDYKSLYIRKPFIYNNKIDKEELTRYVNGFFTNKYKWSFEDEDQWTYSFENVILKYNSDGIIEYTDTTNVGENNNSNVVDSFQVAQRFLERDNKLYQLEYYLDKYEVQNGCIKFYYAYKYNDYKILVSKDIKNRIGLRYPIEIEISNGKVKTYKRLVIELEENLMMQKQEFETSYNTVLNDFLTEESIEEAIEDIVIDDMYLGYYLNSQEGNLEFNWMITVGDTIYRREVNELE